MHRLAIALGLGALTALTFPPLGLWPLAFLGVAGLLHLVRQANGPTFGLGWAFGLGMFALSLGWIARAFTFQTAMPPWLGAVAVGALAAFLGLYWGLAAWVARRLARGRPVALVVALAGAVVVAELLRGELLTGFPWNPLGLALIDLPVAPRAAALWGAPGLSALVVLAAGAGLHLLVKPRTAAALPAALAALLALPGGVWPLPSAPPTDDLFLLVQPMASQADKHAEGGTERHLKAHVELTERTLATLRPQARRRLAAVIWPEGAIEFPLEETPWLRTLVTRALPPQAFLLAGGIAVERGPTGQALGLRNSLSVLDAAGQLRARYDKAHLVPGGEYLPLRALAEPLGLRRLVPGTLDFWPGPGPRTLHLPGLPPLAPAICYEIIFPGAVVDRRDRPAAIVTVSSDAWFGPWGPPQHFAQARLRAIEEGLPILRVTPTGITGVIDAQGRVVASLPAGRAGTLLVPAPGAAPPTPFARWGPALSWGLAALLLALGATLGHRKT